MLMIEIRQTDLGAVCTVYGEIDASNVGDVLDATGKLVHERFLTFDLRDAGFSDLDTLASVVTGIRRLGGGTTMTIACSWDVLGWMLRTAGALDAAPGEPTIAHAMASSSVGHSEKS
jgi:hypothetical protein